MRVTLDRQPYEAGIFRKKMMYQLYGKIDFTEEEKHVIKSTGFANDVFHTYFNDFANEECRILVGELLDKKDDARTLLAFSNSERDVNIIEDGVKEALKQLKQRIEYHGAPRKQTDTFEL